MQAVVHGQKALETKMASAEPHEVHEALQTIRRLIPGAEYGEVRRLAEMVTSLFYIDPLDRPEFVPVIDDAVDLVGGIGEPIIPLLLDILDAGDMKAQLVCGHALSRIGPAAIRPLISEFGSSVDVARRSIIVFALGKIHAPETARAAPLLLTALDATEVELRDTATRAVGKLAESVSAELLEESIRHAFFNKLSALVADANPHIRSKAVRSLGKLARYGHLDDGERQKLAIACEGIIGADEHAQWDNAYMVRKEAEQARRYC